MTICKNKTMFQKLLSIVCILTLMTLSHWIQCETEIEMQSK